MTRVPVSIYKVSDAATPLSEVVRLDGLTRIAASPPTASRGTSAELWLGRSEGEVPEWLKVVGAALAVPNGNLNSYRAASVAGVLCLTLPVGVFVLVFGHAWMRIRTTVVEPNFGVKCVLNICGASSLRALKRDRISGDFIQVLEQSPEDADVFRFGVDPESDLLRGVRASVEPIFQLGGIIAGTDSLKCAWDPAAESLDHLVERVATYYGRMTYKRNFPWVDYIQPLRDPAKITFLDEELANQLDSGGAGLALCVPDFSQWDSYDYFVFGRRSVREVRSTLSLGSWLHHARHHGLTIDAACLSTQKVHGIDIHVPGRNAQWDLRDCLHGMLVGTNYLLHGGEWFQLAEGFVDRIDRQLSDLVPLSTTPLLPSRLGELEGDYNTRMARLPGRIFKLFDRKLVSHGGGHSKIEFCDLLSRENEIVCVKKWSGSSGISHLCRQAVTTCRLLRSDEDFCSKIDVRLKGHFRAAWSRVRRRASRATVVLVVMGTSGGHDLPFFSRLAIVDVAKEIQRLGFNVAMKAV